MLKIAAVVGPTASGKTALAIELAKRLCGEIISCDSMQIYRKMNIGTAKPTEAELDAVPHHMIDIADIGDNFSCAVYADMARERISDIVSRGKIPIFCGGTGLYLDTVINGTEFSKYERDEKLCEELLKKDVAELHSELAKIDPASASVIHQNNKRRVARAIEIYMTTGMTKTEWDEKSHQSDPQYDARIIGLDYKDRDILRKRIDMRVDQMISDGLVDEVKGLSLDRDSTASQAIGYKEIISYLDGDCTLDEAIEKIKIGTHQYAKRQLTWFRRNKNICWLYPDASDSFDNIVERAVEYIASEKS